jgi:hypothetical protein
MGQIFAIFSLCSRTLQRHVSENIFHAGALTLILTCHIKPYLQSDPARVMEISEIFAPLMFSQLLIIEIGLLIEKNFAESNDFKESAALAPFVNREEA